MKLELLKTLIRWVEVMTVAVMYIGENLPEDVRVDLHNAAHDLTEELRKPDNV